MTIDNFIKILGALTALVSALAWPLLITIIVFRLGPALLNFFQSLGEFSLKGAGFEASAKRMQAEATAALLAAEVSKKGSDNPAFSVADAKAAAELVQEEVTPSLIKRAAKTKILWVDDHPENITYTRQSLEAIGITVVHARSTAEALEKIQSSNFNVIISDMGRPPDPRAGYTLLEALRKVGNNIPYIICAAGGSIPANRFEAHRAGAFGSTNKASDVFMYVMSLLRTNL